MTKEKTYKPKLYKKNQVHNILVKLLHKDGFILPHGYIIKKAKHAKTPDHKQIVKNPEIHSVNQMHRYVVNRLKQLGYQLPHEYEIRKLKGTPTHKLK